MIKPQDLRVGNYLETNGNYKPIIWQDIKWCFKLTSEFNEDYKAIPITPEILEKCGFEKYEQAHNTWQFNDFAVRIFPDAVVLINFCDGIELKGFHHLQNVVYDLSGVELKLNI